MNNLPSVIEAELKDFEMHGKFPEYPKEHVKQLARELCNIAVEHVKHPEINVDIEGDLSFDLRLNDGRLVFIELGRNGQLDMSIHQDDRGYKDKGLKHINNKMLKRYRENRGGKTYKDNTKLQQLFLDIVQGNDRSDDGFGNLLGA